MSSLKQFTDKLKQKPKLNHNYEVTILLENNNEDNITK